MHDKLEQKVLVEGSLIWGGTGNIQIKSSPEKIMQNKYYTDQLIKTAPILQLF